MFLTRLITGHQRLIKRLSKRVGVLTASLARTSFRLGWMAALVVGIAFSQQPQAFPDNPDNQSTVHALQSKAPSDECFAGLGLTTALFTTPPCPPAAQPTATQAKVNQGYIWGMTEGINDDLWFGTLANGQCVTQGGITPSSTAPVPYMTDSWVCEFGNSKYIPAVLPTTASIVGDFRPPRIYFYNKTSKVTTDVTPRSPSWVNPTPACPTSTPCNPEGLVGALRNTLGIRAAATITTATDPIVLLAGTNLSPALGLTFFAYNGRTHAFLGARSFAGYGQIRQFTNVGGVLYTAVGRNGCTTAPNAAGTAPGAGCSAPLVGGSILKVGAALTATCANPYANPPTATTPCFTLTLTEVGRTETIGAYLTSFDSGTGNRIYLTTWPDKNLPGKYAALFMSPVIPSAGLPAGTTSWTKVWDITQFEPDPGVANFISGGAIKAFDGSLIWGTLTVPTQAYTAFVRTYCPNEAIDPVTGVGTPCSRDQLNQTNVGTMRAISIFRGKNLDTAPVIDTLYGDAQYPVFTPGTSPAPGTWTLTPNKTGKGSLFGPAGFGNPWNVYTWNMNVWDHRLWVGTFDWSFMAEQGTELLNAQGAGIPPELFSIANYGADVYYFNSSSDPAFPESTHGLENAANFGVRNSVVSGDLYMAMANPMNLLTDPAQPCPTGGPACLGGWELTQLTPKPENTPYGENVTVSMPGGISATFCKVTNGGNTYGQFVTNPSMPDLPVNPLLQPFEFNGPTTPPGTQTPPDQYILLYTTAVWRQGCASPTLATVTVPRPEGLVVPRLFQLQWVNGDFAWVDITASVDWAGGTITGNITTNFLGTLAVMDRINYFGKLSAAAVVPPQNNKETGQMHIQIKKSQDPNVAFLNLTTSKIANFTLADLHWGAPGTNGPVVATLSGPFSPPQKSISGSFSDVQTISASNLTGPFAGWTINQFMQKVADGVIYVDIHTSSAPGGLIRGQIQ